MADLFESLDDEEFFCSFVRAKYLETPKQISAIMHVEHVLSEERLKFAFHAYKQALEKFAIYLHSQNPDHYKRAGALLHALVGAKIVTEVKLESDSESLEAGFTRVTAGDVEHMLPFVVFYETFFNEAIAFQVALLCCLAYESDHNRDKELDLDYVHNMCRYLKCCDYEHLAVDTCFMLFKSLMA